MPRSRSPQPAGAAARDTRRQHAGHRQPPCRHRRDVSISAPFIARPIATGLLAVAMLLAGLLGYRALPVSALPQVDFPTIQVSTQLPGANPDTMATLVTAALERQFGQIQGLADMTSVSSEGTSQITLQFALDRNIDSAAQDVQAAINAAAGTLPTNLPYPPVYSKVNPADAPILTLALESDAMTLDRVSDAADTLLQPKLSQIDGVGSVTVQGAMRPAMRVRVDPARLAGYGLSMEDVRTAIAAANVNGAKGGFDGPRQAMALGANDQLLSPDSYRSLVIAYRNGAAVRLSDVGTVVGGLENDRVGAWYQGRPAVVLDIQRQPGANIVQTVARIKQALPDLERAMPSGMRLSDGDRPHRDHPRQRGRRAGHAAAVDRAGGRRDLPVPAHLARDPHPGGGAAAVADRHVRHDVAARLRARQPLADGADGGDRVRGGRRHRHDRERGALHRGRRAAAGGGVSRRRADRLHHRLAHRLAGGGVHPAAVHDRRGRPAVHRVRGDAVGLGRGLGGGVADADADDVRPAAAPRFRRERPAASPARWRAASRGLLAGYRRTLAWSLRHEALVLLVAVATLVGTIALYVVVPKGFLPLQDTGVIVAVTRGRAEHLHSAHERVAGAAPPTSCSTTRR